MPNDFEISPEQVQKAKRFGAILVPLFALLILFSVFTPFTTVPAGHVGVLSLFGKIEAEELSEGFHFINPFKKVIKIDCRNKELTIESIGVPTRDQLTTSVDVTVKWRVDREMAAEAIQETGDAASLERVHLRPKLRSLIREAGKAIDNAEDFYQNEVQVSMQDEILAGLRELANKGIIVEEVLLRKFALPRMIVEGVEQKKRQKQLAERQIEELKRYTTEQEQQKVKATADKIAAIEEAAKRRELADARAYEVTAEAKAQAAAIMIKGEALRLNPEILKLRAIEQWNGIVPRVSLGGNAIPLLNLNDLGGDDKE